MLSLERLSSSFNVIYDPVCPGHIQQKTRRLKLYSTLLSISAFCPRECALRTIFQCRLHYYPVDYASHSCCYSFCQMFLLVLAVIDSTLPSHTVHLVGWLIKDTLTHLCSLPLPFAASSFLLHHSRYNTILASGSCYDFD